MVLSAGLAAIHMLHLAEVAAGFGVREEELFAGFGFAREELSDPSRKVPLPVVKALIARARTLTGEPALGFFLGQHMRVSAHGYVGFAALASSTLGGALEVAERFTPTRTDLLALRLHREGELASLVIEEREPLEEIADVVVFTLMLGLHEIGVALTGQVLDGATELRFPEPAYFSRFRHLAGDRVRFDQPAHRMIFDASLLDLRIADADPAALRLAREQCERELRALNAASSFRARVRASLRGERGFHTLEEVAALLNVSPRTLKRRLAEEETEFSALLDDERKEHALLLLGDERLSLEEIAERLGYSDSAGFGRAFRRWTGATPASFRKRRSS